jgi:hypothetical protein
MPIPLGVLAVAGAGAGPSAAGAYELLETVSVGTAVASVSFSNLDTNYGSTYQHLQIRTVVTHSGAGGNALSMQLSGDTGANYAYHELIGNGSSASSSALTSQSSIVGTVLMRQNISNTSFAAGVIDILDAFETTKNKTIRSLSGHASTESIVGLTSGVRLNTAAVTSITLFSIGAANIVAGSRFSLYGLRSS